MFGEDRKRWGTRAPGAAIPSRKKLHYLQTLLLPGQSTGTSSDEAGIVLYSLTGRHKPLLTQIFSKVQIWHKTSAHTAGRKGRIIVPV